MARARVQNSQLTDSSQLNLTGIVCNLPIGNAVALGAQSGNRMYVRSLYVNLFLMFENKMPVDESVCMSRRNRAGLHGLKGG